MSAAGPDRCPRCGAGFACGAAGATPCACTGVALSAELQAQLRGRYTGCLCLRCLQALADGASIEPPAPDGSAASTHADAESVADRVRVREVKLLSDHWYTLKTATFDWRRRDGRWQTTQRETYDRGNGAAILLYEPRRRTVVLTRQFRYPVYVNGHDALMIEVPAGLLDGADPEACIRAEAEQEAGLRVRAPREVMRTYTSPGAVTERLHLFVAEYDAADRIGPGGGLENEGEDIEVFECPFDEALAMVERGVIVDAKTILLLQWAALHLFGPR